MSGSIYLDVLVWDVLFLQDCPSAADEGTEPSSIQLQRLLCLMLFNCLLSKTGGVREQIRVWVGFV